MSREDRHAALLTTSSGYAAFVAEEQEMDADLGLVKGFADWLLATGDIPDDIEGWTADQFRAEWNRWKS